MEIGRLATDTALHDLFQSGKYSDLTIFCGKRTFHLHKAIVCSRSPYFAAACEEGRWKEGLQNSIELEAADSEDENNNLGKDDPEAVQCMFEFLYNHAYGASISSNNQNDIHLHAKVYAIGDKYGVPSLKKVALAEFQKDAELAWSVDEFCKAVRIAFTTTIDEDRGLRNIVVRILQERARDVAENSTMERTIRDIDGLAYSLWKAAPHTPGPRCNVCGTAFVKGCVACCSRKVMRGSSKSYFVACECDPQQEACESHQETQGQVGAISSIGEFGAFFEVR